MAREPAPAQDCILLGSQHVSHLFDEHRYLANEGFTEIPRLPDFCETLVVPRWQPPAGAEPRHLFSRAPALQLTTWPLGMTDSWSLSHMAV